MVPENVRGRLNGKSVPGAGMRGGLGRTLLTAFLLLSIVPLSLISFIAATQARKNLQFEINEKFTTLALLAEAQIHNWVAEQQRMLDELGDTVARSYQDQQRDLSVSDLLNDFADTHSGNPALIALLLVDQEGNVLATYPTGLEPDAIPDPLKSKRAFLDAENPLVQDINAASGQPNSYALFLTHSVAESDLTLMALLNPTQLAGLGTSSLWPGQNQDSQIYLVSPSGRALKLNPNDAEIDSLNLERSLEHSSQGIEAVLSGQSGAGSYDNHRGEPVIGAYRWLPLLNMGLLIEQAEDAALEASNDLAIALIGTTLGMVLLTAIIAAAVTRRITLPIVHLTATAVQIAAGDLEQKVPAARHDEIGILARAFNVMTTKLRLLYEDLEQKVRERTQQLEAANAEIRYQAMQLAISAEVGRVVTSILDRDILPSRVVELIRDSFEAYFVAIYFVDENGEQAVLQAATGGLGEHLESIEHRLDLEHNHLVSHAIRNLEPQTSAGASLDHRINRRLFPHTRAELAVPLKIGERIIGALDVHSTQADAFDGNEVMVLETLSGQVVVALENARIYDMERQAAEQLRDLDKLRRRFLSNMSRELRMPLNNIIGFSRVILKGIDGPTTDLQREDLHAIHDSGQQLLVLINDILDIAQIEAGEMELSIQPVDFGMLAHSVIPTISALLEGKDIEFQHDICPSLPCVLADPHRLRQVLVKLLSNAVKFTQEGEIKLRVWPNENQIFASVMDSGMGIPDADREKVFEMFRQLSQPVESSTRGTGLGLTFSKEIVEMHGGRIWLDSIDGEGTAFTFTLPIAGVKASAVIR